MTRTVEETVTRIKHEERLTIRLSAHQTDKMGTLIDAGLYDTKVDFVRQAIDKLLPVELKRADEKTDEEFDYLNLKEKLRALKDAKYQFEQNKVLEKDLLRR